MRFRLSLPLLLLCVGSTALAAEYRSTFSDYKRYEAGEPADWRALNQTVAAPAGATDHAGHGTAAPAADPHAGHGAADGGKASPSAMQHHMHDPAMQQKHAEHMKAMRAKKEGGGAHAGHDASPEAKP